MKALNLFLCTIHLAWLCHTPPGGCLCCYAATSHCTRGIIHAPSRPRISVCVCVCACLRACVCFSCFFCQQIWVCGVCGGFSSFWSSWTNISLLDTHQWGDGASPEVSWAPRVLQALRRRRMTFNQGSGAWAAGSPQESWLYSNPQPQVPPWARTLRQL